VYIYCIQARALLGNAPPNTGGGGSSAVLTVYILTLNHTNRILYSLLSPTCLQVRALLGNAPPNTGGLSSSAVLTVYLLILNYTNRIRMLYSLLSEL